MTPWVHDIWRVRRPPATLLFEPYQFILSCICLDLLSCALQTITICLSLDLLVTVSFVLNCRWASCFVPTPWDLMTTPNVTPCSHYSTASPDTQNTQKDVNFQSAHTFFNWCRAGGSYLQEKSEDQIPRSKDRVIFYTEGLWGLGPVLRSGGLTQENLWTLMCILTGN